MRRAETARVVVSGRGSLRDAASRRSRILVLLGSAFAVVGLTDVALLWIPLRFDSLSWEVATIGRTLDGLPMAVLGLGLVAYGLLGRPDPSPALNRTLAWLFASLSVIVVALGILFATAAPAVLQQTAGETAEGFRRAAIRHGVQAVAYPAALGFIALMLWRAGRGGG